MALTRKSLKAMGIEEEKIDQIMEMHGETVDTLKAQRDENADAAKQLKTVQKQLDDANAELESAKKDSWKVKYDAMKEEYDSYKSDVEGKAAKAAKTDAYRELLKEAGIAEKRIAAVLKVSDVDSIEIVDGKVKDADKLKADIKKEWAEFVVSSSTSGAKNETPASNSGGKQYASKADILAIKDTAERQKAIAENPSLFGI